MTDNHGEITPPSPPTWLQLESVVPLSEGENITSLSPETIEREYGEYVIKLSERRKGIKLKHCLAIADGTIRQRAGRQSP